MQGTWQRVGDTIKVHAADAGPGAAEVMTGTYEGGRLTMASAGQKQFVVLTKE